MSQPENREISDSRSSYSITSTDSIDASPAYSDYKQFACDACFISSTSQSNHAPHICSKETSPSTSESSRKKFENDLDPREKSSIVIVIEDEDQMEKQHLEENETENEKHQVKEQNDPKHSCINSNEDYIESEIQRRLEKQQKLNNLSEIQKDRDHIELEIQRRVEQYKKSLQKEMNEEQEKMNRLKSSVQLEDYQTRFILAELNKEKEGLVRDKIHFLNKEIEMNLKMKSYIQKIRHLENELARSSIQVQNKQNCIFNLEAQCNRFAMKEMYIKELAKANPVLDHLVNVANSFQPTNLVPNINFENKSTDHRNSIGHGHQENSQQNNFDNSKNKTGCSSQYPPGVDFKRKRIRRRNTDNNSAKRTNLSNLMELRVDFQKNGTN